MYNHKDYESGILDNAVKTGLLVTPIFAVPRATRAVVGFLTLGGPHCKHMDQQNIEFGSIHNCKHEPKPILKLGWQFIDFQSNFNHWFDNFNFIGKEDIKYWSADQ